MTLPKRDIVKRCGPVWVPWTMGLALLLPVAASGQAADPATPNHSAHSAHVNQGAAAPAAGKPPVAHAARPSTQKTDAAGRANDTLVHQIAELQAKVARLDAALRRSGMSGMPGIQRKPMAGQMGKGTMGGGMPAMTGGAKPGGMTGGMMMDDMDMMGMGGGGVGGGMMDDMDMMGMSAGGAMPGGGGMGGMPGGMMDDMDDMMGMAPTGSMRAAAALPGFPGASHLYHVGSSGFFLDHRQHITLSKEQRTALSRAKEKALLEEASADRKIEEAEQELWTLTAADEPDVEQIEQAVRKIEKLRGDKRLAFIRAVGEAATLLTPEQRQILLGQQPPAGAPAMGGGGMKDM